MLSPAEEEYILKYAKVPEHIPALMAGISEADLFLIDSYLCLAKDDWLIFVGYPLEGDFSGASFSHSLEKAMALKTPRNTWFIAPEIPESLLPKIKSRESDFYYLLDLKRPPAGRSLIRAVEKASENLSVSLSRTFSKEHGLLTREFLGRQGLPPRVYQLYLRMEGYLSFSKTSLLLSAWDREKRLSAYYVLELGAATFLTYVVGCHSKAAYVPHASDLLFQEMIGVAQKNHKEYIHLGLGVNEGIARFKKKWGGVPCLRYESGEISRAEKSPFSWIQALAMR